MAAIDPEDARLASRLARGDRSAFESLFRKHNAAMVRFCASLTGSRHTSEEVVQDAWIAVLTRIDGFEGRSSLAAWIYAILVNKARSRARRDGRIVLFDDHGDDHGLDAAFDGRGFWKNIPELWDELTPERHATGRSILRCAEEAIENLPPAQRAVLVLKNQEGLESAEICALLDISEGNMRVLLHRARLGVRKAIAAALGER